MLNLYPSPELIAHCKQQLEECSFGLRKTNNGTKEQQLVGLIGESLVKEQFDMPWVSCQDNYETEYDLLYEDLRIDIKTMGRNCYPKIDFVNNLVADQYKYNLDIYVFCSYHKTDNVLTLCGFTSKLLFNVYSKKYNQGTKRFRSDGSSFELKSDLYEIHNYSINPINSIEEFKKDLLDYKLSEID